MKYPIPSVLTSLALYTVKTDETREALELFLSEKNFTKEGDQSTMMRRAINPTINPTDFLNDLNKLSKNVAFSDRDTISLLLPALLKSKTKSQLDISRSVIYRYKFVYDEARALFSNYCEKRDLIRNIQPIKS